MRLYNTLTKKVEDFEPLSKKRVSIYNCGPTVYNFPTLGNLRTYINVDLLRRTLKYLGYEIKEVMNITDIEDKIIKSSQELGISYQELTKKYEKEFLLNLNQLNIETPEHMPHATDEIPEMIKIIEKLLMDGYAYKSKDGSVYFDIKKFAAYGKLSNLDKRELKAGARVAQDEYEKDNAQDFALWKAEKEGEPSWEAPFGKGRPGWHIECTAMSLKYLGEQIDVHSGAVDLVFPHHENEIAQSEAYTKKPFVKYWFHPEHLQIEGKRMGKSLGNYYVLSDLEKRFKVEPLAFRLLCLQSHYRDKLNFTEESIQAAQNTLINLRTDFKRLIFLGSKRVLVQKEKKELSDALENDLAIPRALSLVFDFMKDPKKDINTKYSIVLDIDRVFGLGFDKVFLDEIPREIIDLSVEREKLRKDKIFDKADNVRKKIEDAGYMLEDTALGPFIYK